MQDPNDVPTLLQTERTLIHLRTNGYEDYNAQIQFQQARLQYNQLVAMTYPDLASAQTAWQNTRDRIQFLNEEGARLNRIVASQKKLIDQAKEFQQQDQEINNAVVPAVSPWMQSSRAPTQPTVQEQTIFAANLEITRCQNEYRTITAMENGLQLRAGALREHLNKFPPPIQSHFQPQ